METTYTPAQVVEEELERWRKIEEWRACAHRWLAEMRRDERSIQSTKELTDLARYHIATLEALNGRSEYE